MVANSTGIQRYFMNVIAKNCDKMYAQRAYLHWYTRSGMEGTEFEQAREDLNNLQNDYLSILGDDWSEDDTNDE